MVKKKIYIYITCKFILNKSDALCAFLFSIYIKEHQIYIKEHQIYIKEHPIYKKNHQFIN